MSSHPRPEMTAGMTDCPAAASAAWQELLALTHDRPWLVALLAERGAALALRYALWRQRLLALAPARRRALQRRLGAGLAGAALLLALSGGPTWAAPDAAITVDQTSGVIAVDGKCSLAEAINNANGDTQFSAAAGECAAGTAGLDTITLQTSIGLTADLPNIASAITIEGGGYTIAGNSTFRVFLVSNVASLTLNSATISGGSAVSGAGIYNFGALTVQNSTLIGNSASSAGGGIINTGAVMVQNSTLSGNSASGSGGGIYNRNTGTLTVQNSTLSGNSAFGGGGIRNGNTGAATVQNSTFSGNLAVVGAGIYNSGTLTVQNSTLSSNSASNSGGGIENRVSTAVTVQNSTFSGNSAPTGGGIDINSGGLTVQNSTFSGNLAVVGAGIYNSGTLTVQNSTLSGNSASNGGGIFSFGTVIVQNSVIANSAAGGDCVRSSGTTTVSYSQIEGTGSNACNLTNGVDGNIIGQDPALGALSNGVHVPASNSPVIDAGNTATPGSGGAACQASDQRGQTRNDLRCDIGAVEVKLTDTDTVTKAVVGAGTFTFGPTMAKIVVTTQGSLSQLSVQQHSGDHPNATQMNGQWWGITPTGSGFTANLDLPHTVSPDSDAKVCSHVSGSTWDCDRSGSDAGRVWRDGLTAFSDWAVGDSVGPTAITLRGLTAATGSGGLPALLLMVLGGLGLGAGLRRWGGKENRGRRTEDRGQAAPGPEAAARADYETPAIVQRGTLKHFAGSPLAIDPLDPLNTHK